MMTRRDVLATAALVSLFPLAAPLQACCDALNGLIPRQRLDVRAFTTHVAGAAPAPGIAALNLSQNRALALVPFNRTAAFRFTAHFAGKSGAAADAEKRAMLNEARASFAKDPALLRKVEAMLDNDPAIRGHLGGPHGLAAREQ